MHVKDSGMPLTRLALNLNEAADSVILFHQWRVVLFEHVVSVYWIKTGNFH